MSRNERIFLKAILAQLVLMPVALILAGDVYCQQNDTQTENSPLDKEVSSPLVMTGQTTCYDTWGVEIDCPSVEEAFFGQDAQFSSRPFDFTDNGNGTVTDNVTQLIWQQVPSDRPYNWEDAQEYCENLSFAESIDWRTPSLKELFSISDFSTGSPYIDEVYFVLADTAEFKNQQYWSSDYYEVETSQDPSSSAFAVNHGTGHINYNLYGYPGSAMTTKYVRCVKGEDYAVNTFIDNHDGSVTDSSTGLMWMQQDSLIPLDWENALLFAQQKNEEHYLGHSDWRVPNIKELQSIVNYSGVYPAIDLDYFTISDSEAYFWSSTSAYYSSQYPRYFYAWYVDFDAGAVHFDTKYEGGPERDEPQRIYNFVRLVRDVKASLQLSYLVHI